MSAGSRRPSAPVTWQLGARVVVVGLAGRGAPSARLATLDGERIDIDCLAMRDRTWGPHRPGATRAGDHLWAIASPDAHWHAITGAGDDPQVQAVRNGYLCRDGVVGDLLDGERRVVRRAGDGLAEVVLDAVDEHGRSLHATGEVRTFLRWYGWPGRLTYWALTDWRWDGVRGWGENQELFPLAQARSLRCGQGGGGGARRP